MDHLESDAYKKTCNRCVPIITPTRIDDQLSCFSLKLSFLPGSQRLMASAPLAAHESILNILKLDLSTILATILTPSDITCY